MLKKYLRKIIIVLFLIVISNNAYAEMIIERSVGGKNPYGEIIDNTYHKFWVIADKYSEMIGVKKHRELAFEAIKMMDECLDKDAKFAECTPVVFEERNKMRGNDNSDEAYLNNPILAYKSSVFYAGLMSLQIYAADNWEFHKSWKDEGKNVLGQYVNSMKKVISDELGKKLNSNNIEISSLKEDKKNIDKKIKLYNDFFVTIPNYYIKEIGDIGNKSVYEKKLGRLLAENKKINRANSDLIKIINSSSPPGGVYFMKNGKWGKKVVKGSWKYVGILKNRKPYNGIIYNSAGKILYKYVDGMETN